MTITVDTRELAEKVQRMYRAVATEARGAYHFELGRSLAERLGYPADVLDELSEGAIESFAGVGYFFDLAELRPGERVVDLGSGSGMDVFFACTRVGPRGRMLGVDVAYEQLSKARALAQAPGFDPGKQVVIPRRHRGREPQLQVDPAQSGAPLHERASAPATSTARRASRCSRSSQYVHRATPSTDLGGGADVAQAAPEEVPPTPPMTEEVAK